ncbi:AlpA family phage regulatory protein [Rhizobium ruizarguesonis]|nr:AlpA family phage regulatory protein [Rhizobium ruizarguesonis]
MSIPVLVRFPHLKARGVVNNWPQLSRLIRDHQFPPGMLIGPNTRAWREDEVEDWLARRPTASKLKIDPDNPSGPIPSASSHERAPSASRRGGTLPSPGAGDGRRDPRTIAENSAEET